MNKMFPSQTTMLGSVLALCLVSLIGCGGRQEKAGAPRAVRTVPVEVTVARMQDLSVTKTYSGSLEGEEQADVVARLAEHVTEIKVAVGAQVRAGQAIVLLDKAGASSQYYQAEATFTNAQKNLDRMKSLYGEGAISLQALDGAQTAYDVARANFEAARSSVELTAPIAGTVTAVNVTSGDLATPGDKMATVAKIDRMKVTFDIDEVDAASLAIGLKALIYSDNRPDVKAEGQVTQLSRSADVRSRSFEVRAAFANTPDKWFRPGMFCRVDVRVTSQRKTLAVPNSAIESDGLQSRVFVVKGGRAFEKAVQIGLTDGQTTAIIDGLAEGDTVATVGVSSLRDSVLVSITGN